MLAFIEPTAPLIRRPIPNPFASPLKIDFDVYLPISTLTTFPPYFITLVTNPEVIFYPTYLTVTSAPIFINYYPPIDMNPFIPYFTKALFTTLNVSDIVFFNNRLDTPVPTPDPIKCLALLAK